MRNQVFPCPIAEEIWGMKYRYRDNPGTPHEVIHDQIVQDTWMRIATALAECETELPKDEKFEPGTDPKEVWS